MCLIKVAIEVKWFELKENITETKVKKCVAKCNIDWTKNEAIAEETENENYTNNTDKR